MFQHVGHQCTDILCKDFSGIGDTLSESKLLCMFTEFRPFSHFGYGRWSLLDVEAFTLYLSWLSLIVACRCSAFALKWITASRVLEEIYTQTEQCLDEQCGVAYRARVL